MRTFLIVDDECEICQKLPAVLVSIDHAEWSFCEDHWKKHSQNICKKGGIVTWSKGFPVRLEGVAVPGVDILPTFSEAGSSAH